MELYDQDDLYQIMEFIIYGLQYKCYLRFYMPGNCKKLACPHLRVVIPQMHYITIGIQLDEIMANLNKFGLEKTCNGIKITLDMALEKIRRDHPELGGEQ